MIKTMFDCIIIGAGEAGAAAALAAARNKIKVLVLDREARGLPAFDGEQGESKGSSEVVAVEKNIVSFSVETKSGKVFYGRSIIIATGKNGGELETITAKELSGNIKVDANMATSVEGVFAIGGCNNALDGDETVKTGEGAKAALAVAEYLKGSK
ncbi:MAG: hypothetical protein COT92_01215 [Candidatus Doudnabacteria bacterium CG10_big_fil_rev_8_21_14_0_10_42_18]|uniref:FAD/NAD(P)-binding domain-containing protein n=1 Tax=Candidatus Doudnabacteria bacterium CG10_big_fil_rev_8_21_14_0_10_42_18 TaxID=1974552 RepID=A0A2H0VBE5_9BACT|nr:MAG: hypothetical protein COT92_01215 [Candidatus Doudnabacteria bacterium CG10_big_fil_rev_8_21_14_0_10_42_18]